MAGMFDDLIPAKGGGGMFADLIPKEKPKGVYGDVPKRGQSRSVRDEVQGFMSHLNRSLLIGDEVTAAGATVGNVLTGKTRIQDAPKDFSRNMLVQRGVEQDYQARRPLAASTAQGVGNSVLLAAPGAPAVANGTRVGNMARGALVAAGTAASYGALDAGTPEERLRAANRNATNPLVLAVGAAGGALAPASRRPATPKPATPQRTLRDAGVSLTPGQSMGGMAKSVEDLGQRAPILGPAIRGARERSVQSLNRSVANRALEPIGEAVPVKMKPGHESVTFVAQRLGKAYDDAADMVPQVAPDQEFGAALDRISQELPELGDDLQRQFQAIMQNRVASRLGGGPVTGRQLRQVQEEIGQIAAKRSGSDDVGQQALGQMLEGVSDEMKNLLGRASPEAGALISQANQGWSAYVRLRGAASKAKGGVFSPSQLTTAVRMLDRSVGKGNVAKGQAVLQDLSDAASQIMPDGFGNPGTADAVGLGALGTGLVTAPAQTVPLAVGLAAAATPYFLMGRRVVEAIPRNASAQQIQQAQRQLAELAAKDPAVAALQRELAARLSTAAGTQGGAALAAPPQPRNVLATAPQ